MIQQIVINTVTKKVLRRGYCDFENDGSFNAEKESIIEKEFLFSDEENDYEYNEETETFNIIGTKYKKNDLDIMDEIFQTADTIEEDINGRTQQQRFLYALDEKKSSFPLLVRSSIRSNDWTAVLNHIVGAVSEEILIQIDQDLIFNILP